MSAAEAVFDTQNSQSGRHFAMPIPGVSAEDERWWNVLSVGAKGAGLGLHEHGAAWLALGSGRCDRAPTAAGSTSSSPVTES
jgi:hypothetical protein